MIHSTRTLAALLFVFSLVGCGQSGPLYLPGNPSEVHSLPTQLPELSEEDEDETDKSSEENDGG
jgi:predicted small lipoprotein YifL